VISEEKLKRLEDSTPISNQRMSNMSEIGWTVPKTRYSWN